MAPILFARLPSLPQVGATLVPKRSISVRPSPTNRPAASVGNHSLSFRLVIEGDGGGTSLCPRHLDNAELQRLNRALAYTFASLQRVSVEGVTEKDNLPAVTAWTAANVTHWIIARNLLVTVMHETAYVRKLPSVGHGIPCLAYIDPPETLRSDPYGNVTDEQAVKMAIKAAGWLTVILKALAVAKKPAPQARLSPQMQPRLELVFKRDKSED